MEDLSNITEAKGSKRRGTGGKKNPHLQCIQESRDIKFIIHLSKKRQEERDGELGEREW